MIAKALLIALTCMLTNANGSWCEDPEQITTANVAGVQISAPTKTGPAMDLVTTAESVLAWDIESGQILYEKNSHQQRPIASVTKLLSALTVRECLDLSQVVVIPTEVRKAQQAGVDVKLVPGEHVLVSELLKAGLVPSANDAMIALAQACAGSENDFVNKMNIYALTHGMAETKATNATGLSGGDQYATATDVRKMLELAYADDVLRADLAASVGEITSVEGSKLKYKTTNELLGTYIPILAGKTGFTLEAKENLAVISQTNDRHTVGIVVLGSDQRFVDTKLVMEWIERNYSWPDTTRYGG